MHPAASQTQRRRARNDLELYERHAHAWWDPRSRAFRSLHRVNAYRVELLRAWVGSRLRGARVVDLGCGGGLMARPLAALGARIVGLDLGPRTVKAASQAVADRACGFVRGDLTRAPLRDGCADLVLLADVLEHVEPQARALAEAARLLRPGGLLFVNTISRTLRARVLAVHVAEGLGYVPRGTHDPRLFVRPQELEAYARGAGLRPLRVQGEAPALLRTLAARAVVLRQSRSLALGYSALLELPAAPAGRPRRAPAAVSEAAP